MPEFNTPEELRQYLSRDLLGQIPLFFEEAVVRDRQSPTSDASTMHRRTIAVAAYQTEQYETRAYHKPISKIVK